MKKVLMIQVLGVLLFLQSAGQQPGNAVKRTAGIHNLIGQWEIVGTKDDKGRLEILDSSTILISYGGEKKPLNSFKIDFSKTPIWFDFSVKDTGDVTTVKSIMELISDDLIKWQVFMNEERLEYFSAEKGELFFLKRIKIKTVTTFASLWDKKNYSALRN